MSIVGSDGDGGGDGACYPGMTMTFVYVDILGSVQMNILRKNFDFL